LYALLLCFVWQRYEKNVASVLMLTDFFGYDRGTHANAVGRKKSKNFLGKRFAGIRFFYIFASGFFRQECFVEKITISLCRYVLVST